MAADDRGSPHDTAGIPEPDGTGVADTGRQRVKKVCRGTYPPFFEAEPVSYTHLCLELRREYEELKKKIEYHSHLYYDLDAPELDDFEFDALTRKLKEIEAQHPEFVTETSFTQHVGGTASSRFEKVEHAVKTVSYTHLPAGRIPRRAYLPFRLSGGRASAGAAGGRL